MAKNREIFDIHREEIHMHSGEDMLRHWAMSPEDFSGKTVLDVGSGPKTLDKYLKDQGVEATVVSYDVDEQKLSPAEEDEFAVVGNYYEGLPFEDDSFDLIVNDAGPLSGNPVTQKYRRKLKSVDKIYGTALRTLRPGGEIRTFNPFNEYKFDMGISLYWMAKEGRISFPENFDFADLYDNPEDMELDGDGLPLPLGPSGQFWRLLYEAYGKEKQKPLVNEVCKYMQGRFKRTGFNTSVEPIEINEPVKEEEDDDQYNFCLVIKLKSKTAKKDLSAPDIRHFTVE